MSGFLLEIVSYGTTVRTSEVFGNSPNNLNILKACFCAGLYYRFIYTVCFTCMYCVSNDEIKIVKWTIIRTHLMPTFRCPSRRSPQLATFVGEPRVWAFNYVAVSLVSLSIHQYLHIVKPDNGFPSFAICSTLHLHIVTPNTFFSIMLSAPRVGRYVAKLWKIDYVGRIHEVLSPCKINCTIAVLDNEGKWKYGFMYRQ